MQSKGSERRSIKELCADCPFLTVEEFGKDTSAYICKKGWLGWPTRTLDTFNPKYPAQIPLRPAWCREPVNALKR